METLAPPDGVLTLRDRLDRIITLALRSLRFWRPALVLFLIGGAVSATWAMTRKRTYRSETLILYREAIRASAIDDNVVGDPARRLGLRLKEMVLSRTRLQQIITEFALYPKLVEDRGYVDAVDAMRDHITFRVRDGDTFGLAFDGDDPKKVQQVTARLAEVLIDENSRNRVEQATVTKEFLDQEQQRAEDELREKESALAKFVAEHPQFAREPASGTAVRTAPEQRRAGAPRDPAVQAMEREIARLEERLGAVPERPAPAPERHKMVVEAEAELAAARRELAEQLGRFTDQHPDVRSAKAKVAAAEARLERWTAVAAAATPPPPPPAPEITAEARAELEESLAKARAQLAALRSRAGGRRPGAAPAAPGKLTQEALRVVELETDWARLNRELVEARDRNQKLEDRRFRATIAASSVSSLRNAQIKIVDPAYLPTHPTTTGRKVALAAGLAASMLLSMLLALLLALLDDRIYDRADLERLELAPLLAVVPRPGRRRRLALLRRAEE